MKKIALSWLIVLLSLVFSASVYASDAPENVRVVSTTDSTAIIEWNEVESAYGYSVSYGTETGNYSLEVPGVIQETMVKLENLDKDVKYYLVVKSLDINTADESVASDELVFSLSNAESQTGLQVDTEFKLLEVEVLYTNKISLRFNSELENEENSLREFRIVNTQNEFDEIEVESTQVDMEDPTKLIVTLVSEVENNTEYALTTITINDVNGRTIESGVDSQELFYVSEDVPTFVEVTVEGNEENMSNEEKNNNEAQEKNFEIIENGELELNSAEEQEDNTTLAGTNIEDAEVTETTLSAAADQETLPQTGPEHVLIFILTVILGTLVFVLRYKKV